MSSASYTLNLLPTTADSAAYYTTASRTNDNAGVDLYVPQEVVFQPGEKKLVSMEVKATLVSGGQTCTTCECCGCAPQPETVHYWMLSRSSISKTGLLLLNSVGVIDRTYRGELMAFLWNTKDTPVTVLKGDRLVQIVAPDMGWISQVSVVEELDSTARGDGGFGSTGQ
jgi:deoxyuridine 5'-triphosphate nucleotidohydrolase